MGNDVHEELKQNETIDDLEVLTKEGSTLIWLMVAWHAAQDIRFSFVRTSN